MKSRVGDVDQKAWTVGQTARALVGIELRGAEERGGVRRRAMRFQLLIVLDIKRLAEQELPYKASANEMRPGGRFPSVLSSVPGVPSLKSGVHHMPMLHTPCWFQF